MSVHKICDTNQLQTGNEFDWFHIIFVCHQEPASWVPSYIIFVSINFNYNQLLCAWYCISCVNHIFYSLLNVATLHFANYEPFWLLLDSMLRKQNTCFNNINPTFHEQILYCFNFHWNYYFAQPKLKQSKVLTVGPSTIFNILGSMLRKESEDFLFLVIQFFRPCIFFIYFMNKLILFQSHVKVGLEILLFLCLFSLFMVFLCKHGTRNQHIHIFLPLIVLIICSVLASLSMLLLSMIS